jgi:hypothetical protein
LLVVISIVAVLAGMLIPAVSAVRDAARTTNCLSNQRQFMLGVISYAGDQEGRTPPADGANTVAGVRGHHEARLPHLMLMKQELVPQSHLVSWGTYGWCDWDYGSMRWPNPLSCPAIRPTANPTSQLFYGVRWFTSAPAPDSGKHDDYGSWRTADLSPDVPYLGDVTNPVAIGINSYWISRSPNWGSVPYLVHRKQAVMGYKDGRVQTRNESQLLGEDRLLTVQKL